ncbi:EamA family transporter [Falsiroseomonas oryziterrae]|uniref:EamA family transporter n=1 Tax=Falsiroseomonas oryziterrae TaxID=2911368 RepID=UPI003556DFEC
MGVAAGLMAASIWGGALAVTRLGVAETESGLGPHDIALLRFIGPAALLLPLGWRAARRLSQGQWLGLLALIAGGGAPFVLLAGAGLREASVADAGVLLPGTVPLWVAAASALPGRRGAARLSLAQMGGLALIALAVALVAGPAFVGGMSWRAPALLIAASWLSALYTLALRGAGLMPLEAAALVSLGSVLCFAPAYLLVLEPGLHLVGWQEIGLQAMWQGGLSGTLAPVAFAAAVARLGAARASAFGALSPVAAALFGLLLLGEVPETDVALGLAMATLGVLLAASAPSRAWTTAPCHQDAGVLGTRSVHVREHPARLAFRRVNGGLAGARRKTTATS